MEDLNFNNSSNSNQRNNTNQLNQTEPNAHDRLCRFDSNAFRKW
jgi:hypothetical protein